MHPFRLERLRDDPMDKLLLNHRIIYKKNEYNPMVKISDWEQCQHSLPIDTDPYCPGSQNYSLSHYKRLGWGPDEPYTTTTQAMLEEVYTKRDSTFNSPPRKYMINYFGFNDLEPCQDKDENKYICEEDPVNDWITTMQDSYMNPFPQPIQRLSVPTIPFLKYRKLGEGAPNQSDKKFYDEGFSNHLETLQRVKGDRYRSFNPMLGVYTDEATDDAEISCSGNQNQNSPGDCEHCRVNNVNVTNMPCLRYFE